MQGRGSNDHARRTACRDFLRGQCYHPDCHFSHTIIDCSKLIRLSQDVSINGSSPHTRLKFEYRAATHCDELRGASGVWLLSVPDGRRTRTVKNKNAAEMVKLLGQQLSGSSSSETTHQSHTICKKHLSRSCMRRAACPHRHDLFDTSRVEVIGQKLQSTGRTDIDTTVVIAFTGNLSSGSGQWHVAFKVPHEDDHIEAVFADSDLGAAVAAAESRLSDIPMPETMPTPTLRSTRTGRRNTASILSPVNLDVPPSYEAATAGDLPKYDSVPESPYTSRLARSRARSTTPHPASSSQSASWDHSSSVSVSSAVSPSFSFPSCTRNRGHTTTARDVRSSERRPLLQHNHNIHVTYNSINQPRQESRSTSEWGRRPQDEGTPLILQFLALVMLSAISWVIIVVITLPCTEASC